MACLGFVTFFPLRPLFSLPSFISFISRSTLLLAAGPYLRPELLFFADDFLLELFFAGLFFVELFLLAVFLLDDFLLADFLVVDFLLADFFVPDFLLDDFLVPDFFAADFLVAIRILPVFESLKSASQVASWKVHQLRIFAIRK
jgi:hypothetical protein